MMRMHGFSLMAMILTSLADDRGIVLAALQCMEKWRTQIRNKIEDSGIEEPIKVIAAGDDAELAAIAQRLLDYWSTLELSYRIPRRSKIASVSLRLTAETDVSSTTMMSETRRRSRKRMRLRAGLCDQSTTSRTRTASTFTSRQFGIVPSHRPFHGTGRRGLSRRPRRRAYRARRPIGPSSTPSSRSRSRAAPQPRQRRRQRSRASVKSESTGSIRSTGSASETSTAPSELSATPQPRRRARRNALLRLLAKSSSAP